MSHDANVPNPTRCKLDDQSSTFHGRYGNHARYLLINASLLAVASVQGHTNNGHLIRPTLAMVIAKLSIIPVVNALQTALCNVENLTDICKVVDINRACAFLDHAQIDPLFHKHAIVIGNINRLSLNGLIGVEKATGRPASPNLDGQRRRGAGRSDV